MHIVKGFLPVNTKILTKREEIIDKIGIYISHVCPAFENVGYVGSTTACFFTFSSFITLRIIDRKYLWWNFVLFEEIKTA